MPWDTSRYVASAKQAGEWALKREAQRILESSKNIVPLNKEPSMAWHRGTLQRSGSVLPGETDLEVVIGYSAMEDGYDYALIQHEIPMNHEAGLQDHYLSSRIEEMGQDAIKAIGESIKDSLRRTR